MTGGEALLEDLALVLVVAAVVTVLFRLLGQPALLGYLLAGMIIGPHVPIPLFVDLERVRTLSELGVILVMFAVGLHFSVRTLFRLLPTAGLTGLIQMGGMMWLGFAVGQLLGWSSIESVFVGAMIAISSTMVVARILDDTGAEPAFGELVFGVLVVQDLVAVLLLALLTTLASGGAGTGVMAETALELGGFLVATMVVGLAIVPRAIRKVASLGSSETLLITATGLAFALALIAHQLGFSVALGAFLAGSLVADSGQAAAIEKLIAPLRDLFAAVFFVAVGMIVDPRAIASEAPAIALLVAVVLLGQTTLVTLGTFLGGHDLRTSIRTGLALAQIGEFSFIIASVGAASGAVSERLYPVAVAVAAVTGFATPHLVRRSAAIARAIEGRLPARVLTFATLYGSWREALRTRPRSQTMAARVRRLILWLAVDLAALAALTVGAALAERRYGPALAGLVGLAPRWAALPVLVVAAILGLPFAIGVVRAAGRLGAVLAASVLPAVADGELDLAAAPRRVLVLTFRLTATLLVGLPLLALSQAIVPTLVGAGVLVAVLVVQSVAFWRSAENLAQHVAAGAQVVASVIARHASPAEHARVLGEVGDRLPGLGQLTAIRLDATSAAIGRSLVDLDLRGRTGASVLAIGRAEGTLTPPTGREALEVGDVVTLTGTTGAVAQATALLRGER